MAVRDDGQYYTSDSFYADSGDHYAETQKVIDCQATQKIRSLLKAGCLYI